MKPDNIIRECDHKWLYKGTVCRCEICGAYLQPNGDVTGTPNGRNNVVYHIDEASDVSCEAGEDTSIQLPNFLKIWDNSTRVAATRPAILKTDITTTVNNEMLSELMILLNNVIADKVLADTDTYDTIAKLITGSGLLGQWTSNKFRELKMKVIPSATALPCVVEIAFNVSSDIFAKTFIERFVTGRESISGLLAYSPIIDLHIKPEVMHRCRTADILLETIRSAVQYYSTGIDRATMPLQTAIFQTGEVMRQYIIGTRLKSILVLIIMQLLHQGSIVVGPTALSVTDDTIAAISEFIDIIQKLRGMPREQQDGIIQLFTHNVMTSMFAVSAMPDDIFKMLTGITADLRSLCNISTSVDNDHVRNISQNWTEQQVDSIVMTEAVAAYRGKVKRLKKLPADLVSYVVIEGEAIRDPNDKMLITSYAYSKIEIVDWYIELIDVQSKRYIVPHTRDYLVNLKRDLLSAVRKIMNTPIAKPGDPIISVQYPTGYEG